MQAREWVVPLVAPVPLSNGADSTDPTYSSFLIVAAASKFQRVEDLRGSTFAYNDNQSLSGYHCM